MLLTSRHHKGQAATNPAFRHGEAHGDWQFAPRYPSAEPQAAERGTDLEVMQES